jgi:hypothetical protein
MTLEDTPNRQELKGSRVPRFEVHEVGNKSMPNPGSRNLKGEFPDGHREIDEAAEILR